MVSLAAMVPAVRRAGGLAATSKRSRAEVVRKGALAALLGPVGVAIALVIVGVPAIFAWNIHKASEARRALHDSTHTVGETARVETPVVRKVADGEVELVLRQVDGNLVRVIAAKDATDELINGALIALDKARRSAKDGARLQLDQLFERAFASRKDDLDAYADWFFGWGQSWRLLYEAVVGALQETARLAFSQTQVADAARHSVEDYLLRHYQEFVLKPALRDPTIVAGVGQTFKEANRDYLAALAELDAAVWRFAEERAAFAETLDARAVSVRLDWDAEKWRAPRGPAEDRYLDPVKTVALAGGGAVALKPVVARVALPLLARTTAKVMASTRMAVAGAAVGSVQPGLGTAIGATAGVALDWGMNAVSARFERDDFIAENAAALDATIAAWKEGILPEVDRAIDVWFDDASATVAKLAER
jgi:hypothetical protein